MLSFKKFYSSVVIVISLLGGVTIRSHAIIPANHFHNIDHFFIDPHYSPILGKIALDTGLIYNLRFFGNFTEAYDKDNNRHYAEDKSDNDFVWNLVKILFPSTGGTFASESGLSYNFGRYATPETVSLLLNALYKFRNPNPKPEIDNKSKEEKSEISKIKAMGFCQQSIEPKNEKQKHIVNLYKGIIPKEQEYLSSVLIDSLQTAKILTEGERLRLKNLIVVEPFNRLKETIHEARNNKVFEDFIKKKKTKIEEKIENVKDLTKKEKTDISQYFFLKSNEIEGIQTNETEFLKKDTILDSNKIEGIQTNETKFLNKDTIITTFLNIINNEWSNYVKEQISPTAFKDLQNMIDSLKTNKGFNLFIKEKEKEIIDLVAKINDLTENEKNHIKFYFFNKVVIPSQQLTHNTSRYETIKGFVKELNKELSVFWKDKNLTEALDLEKLYSEGEYKDIKDLSTKLNLSKIYITKKKPDEEEKKTLIGKIREHLNSTNVDLTQEQIQQIEEKKIKKQEKNNITNKNTIEKFTADTNLVESIYSSLNEVDKFNGKDEESQLKGQIKKILEYIFEGIKIERDGFYPKYTTEQIILAFLCHRFNGKEDIKKFLEKLFHIESKIVDENKKNDGIKLTVLEKKDLDEIAKKESHSIEELYALFNSSNLTKNTPYDHSGLVSNGNAWLYNREKDQIVQTNTFADCLETVIRHLCNLFLYNNQNGDRFFDFSNILNSLKIEENEEQKRDAIKKLLRNGQTSQLSTNWNEHIKNVKEHLMKKELKPVWDINPNLANFLFFYAYQNPSLANSGEITIRSLWNAVVGDMNGTWEGHQFIRNPEQNEEIIYNNTIKSNDEEYNTRARYINLILILKKCFDLELSGDYKEVSFIDENPRSKGNEEQKKEWIKGYLEAFFHKLNPIQDRTLKIDMENVSWNDKEKDLFGKVLLTIKQGGKELFSTTLEVVVGHATIGKLKDNGASLNKEHQKIIKKSLKKSSQDMTSRKIIDLLVDNESAKKPALYSLYKNVLNDNDSIGESIQFLLNKKSRQDEYEKNILQNLLTHRNWNDRYSANKTVDYSFEIINRFKELKEKITDKIWAMKDSQDTQMVFYEKIAEKLFSTEDSEEDFKKKINKLTSNTKPFQHQGPLLSAMLRLVKKYKKEYDTIKEPFNNILNSFDIKKENMEFFEENIEALDLMDSWNTKIEGGFKNFFNKYDWGDTSKYDNTDTYLSSKLLLTLREKFPSLQTDIKSIIIDCEAEHTKIFFDEEKSNDSIAFKLNARIKEYFPELEKLKIICLKEINGLGHLDKITTLKNIYFQSDFRYIPIDEIKKIKTIDKLNFFYSLDGGKIDLNERINEFEKLKFLSIIFQKYIVLPEEYYNIWGTLDKGHFDHCQYPEELHLKDSKTLERLYIYGCENKSATSFNIENYSNLKDLNIAIPFKKVQLKNTGELYQFSVYTHTDDETHITFQDNSCNKLNIFGTGNRAYRVKINGFTECKSFQEKMSILKKWGVKFED